MVELDSNLVDAYWKGKPQQKRLEELFRPGIKSFIVAQRLLAGEVDSRR